MNTKRKGVMVISLMSASKSISHVLHGVHIGPKDEGFWQSFEYEGIGIFFASIAPWSATATTSAPMARRRPPWQRIMTVLTLYLSPWVLLL